MVKSDYDKLLERVEQIGFGGKNLLDALDFIIRYIDKIQWYKMSPASREALWQNAIEPALKTIFDKFVKEHVEEWKEYWKEKKRWRPVYDYITSYLEEQIIGYPNFAKELLSDLKKSPTQVYKFIATELGISWRTVRDYFSLTRFKEVLE